MQLAYSEKWEGGSFVKGIDQNIPLYFASWQSTLNKKHEKGGGIEPESKGKT